MSVIKVHNLTKRFGDLIAVDHVSFEVEEGSIFGLLGPNGAGKTTTIECMIGLKKADAGSIKILDMDVLKVGKDLYKEIGVQLQETSYQDKIKVSELCGLFEAMYDAPLDYRPLLDKFGIGEKVNAYINNLSGGQKQKVAIILALISNPKVIFLDELTTGLDPKARREMWDHVKQLKAEGRTVFMTTHYMEEAAFLCDKIGIIDSGKIIVIDDVEGVINHAGLSNEVTFESQEDIKDHMTQVISHAQIAVDGQKISIKSEEDDLITDVVLYLNKNKVSHKNMNIYRPTLEDAYLKLTGKRWEA